MKVLATQFKANMSLREGYLSISDVVENNFKQHIFNSCIKLTPKKDEKVEFTKWLAYWEGSPVLIEMTVLTTVLPTGYVKVTIVDKAVRGIDEVGFYPGKQSKTMVEYRDGKLLVTEEDLRQAAQKYLNSNK